MRLKISKTKILYVSLGIIILAVVFFCIFHKRLFYRNFPVAETKQKDTLYVPLERYGIVVDSFKMTEDVVKKDENLSAILLNFKVTPLTISILADSFRKVFNFKKIIPGNKYLLLLSKNASAKAKYFIYEENIIDFIVCKLDSPVTVYRDHKKSDTILKSMGVVIDTSLWVDMISHGASPELIITLADVFAWQIDFFSIYENDKIKVIYQQVRVEGRSAGLGKIIAAWFQHAGEDNYAFYFRRDSLDEYFDQKGNCLRRIFLKAPLKFSFISSYFSGSRFHPILRIFTPHYGIDYVAPRGTPVHTVGDGTVISAGWAGGAGYMVLVRHNATYMTGYNHLCGFARGIHSDSRVRQGDVVGYVGTTGLSTGPHLDFRMWKNGSPVNPLRLKFPPVKALEKEKMPEFNKVKGKWMNELSKIRVEE